MILKYPFFISSRLLPALNVGALNVSYCLDTGYFYFDYDGMGIHIEKLFRPSPMHRGNIQSIFGAMLDFMSAGAEAYRYELGGKKSDNSGLFPEKLMEILYLNSEEIQYLQLELEDNTDLIITSNE